MSLTDDLIAEDEDISPEEYAVGALILEWVTDGNDPRRLMDIMTRCNDLFDVSEETIH